MSNAVTLCIFLLLIVEGVCGSEVTINVGKNASVTLVCSISENLRKCSCPSYPDDCSKCTEQMTLTSPVHTENTYKDKYFRLSGLEHKNSGLYVCFPSYKRTFGKKYRLNVLEDRGRTLVIGSVGQSINISCGTELDIMAASEKYWCRLANDTSCQPDTIMSPEKEIRGDFQILDGDSSFSLQKHQLTHSDTGFYKLTLILQNQTKVCVEELQVKDTPNFLQIHAVQVEPNRLEITCQYSQDLEEFSKSWLCDSLECSEAVKTIEDRFQSALVLTIDQAACSSIRAFHCVVTMPGRNLKSAVYKPSSNNPVVEVDLYNVRKRKVQVNAYSLLNLICHKPTRYSWGYDDNWGSRGWLNDYHWCRMTAFQCLREKNVEQTTSKLTLQICVTPNDDGVKYHCLNNWWNPNVEIVVNDLHPPPPLHPAQPGIPRSQSGIKHSVGFIVAVTSIILIIVLCVIITYYKGQRLRERCLVMSARRTPLSAVDIHANMYANSVAHYYSHRHRQEPTAVKHHAGSHKETTSSSDDEFEELPVRPKTSSSMRPEDTDYVPVEYVNTLLSNTEQGQGGPPLCIYDTVVGLGRKGDMGNTSRTSTEAATTKQDAAQSGSGCSDNKEDDDEDEVTYTDVIIKPKYRYK